MINSTEPANVAKVVGEAYRLGALDERAHIVTLLRKWAQGYDYHGMPCNMLALAADKLERGEL